MPRHSHSCVTLLLYGRSRKGERCERILCLTQLQTYPLSTADMSRFDLKHKPPKSTGSFPCNRYSVQIFFSNQKLLKVSFKWGQKSGDKRFIKAFIKSTSHKIIITFLFSVHHKEENTHGVRFCHCSKAECICGHRISSLSSTVLRAQTFTWLHILLLRFHWCDKSTIKGSVHLPELTVQKPGYILLTSIPLLPKQCYTLPHFCFTT